jgi:hypothetical protein
LLRKYPVGIGKRGKNLQPENGIADLEQGTMLKGSIRVFSAAGYGNTVHQYITADARADQEAGAVLPGKVKMLGTNAGAWNHQVTGTERSQNSLPGHREPGIQGKLVAA